MSNENTNWEKGFWAGILALIAAAIAGTLIYLGLKPKPAPAPVPVLPPEPKPAPVPVVKVELEMKSKPESPPVPAPLPAKPIGFYAHRQPPADGKEKGT